jgi:endogenous inhibitor of DNA gyrase (YacG/DUF329 family)
MKNTDYLPCESCGRETTRIYIEAGLPSCNTKCDDVINRMYSQETENTENE